SPRPSSSASAAVPMPVAPSAPTSPPTLTDLTQTTGLLRARGVLMLRNTRAFNVWRLPAISLPCGFTQGGLPIGLQIIGPHWKEGRVLALAQAYEQATDWHARKVNLEG